MTLATAFAGDASLRLRDARRDDLDAIVAIYNQTIASRDVTADLEPVSVASREAWFAAHNAALRPLWVVERETPDSAPEIVGWLSYSDFYGRPAYQATAELSIYLGQAARGMGLGSRLLETALAQAPRYAIDTVLAFIFGHNGPSLALFRKYGFATWGTLPGVAALDGVERDLLILGRRLSD